MSNETSPAARFKIIVLIRHPDMDPNKISEELGLEPNAIFRAGDERTTPTGHVLSGRHTETRWNHIFRFQGTRELSSELENIVRVLAGHKSFFQKLSLQRGTLELYVQLPGDVNIGDAISWQILKDMADLRFSLGLEVFPNFPETLKDDSAA
jgi:hypothetical protein